MMKTPKKFHLLILCLHLALMAGMTQENLIYNGDFEIGDTLPDGWEYQYPSSSYLSDTGGRNNSKCLFSMGNSYDNSLRQKVTGLIPGQKYRASAYLKMDKIIYPFETYCSANIQFVNYSVYNPMLDWEKISTDIWASDAGELTVYFKDFRYAAKGGSYNAGPVIIDDVSLVINHDTAVNVALNKPVYSNFPENNDTGLDALITDGNRDAFPWVSGHYENQYVIIDLETTRNVYCIDIFGTDMENYSLQVSLDSETWSSVVNKKDIISNSNRVKSIFNSQAARYLKVICKANTVKTKNFKITEIEAFETANPGPENFGANFMTDRMFTGEEISITDITTGYPDKWSWKFEGADIESSDARNPVVTYDQPGLFYISQTAENAVHCDNVSSKILVYDREAELPGIIKAVQYSDKNGGEDYKHKLICLQAGDWAEYPVDVKETGIYNIKFKGVCDSTENILEITSETGLIHRMNATAFYQFMAIQVFLEKGKQTLRFSVINGGYDLDEMVFEFKGEYLSDRKICPQYYANMHGISIDPGYWEGRITDMDSGDWIEYLFHAEAAGQYKLSTGTYSDSGGGMVQFECNNELQTEIEIPQSNIEIYTETYVYLKQGQNTIKIIGKESGFMLTNILLEALSINYKADVKVEAEDYVSMEGVKTEPCQDEGGGLNVGWIDDDDRMSYEIEIPGSGEYAIMLRVASVDDEGRIKLSFDNGEYTIYKIVNVPNTGGWQNWGFIEQTVYLEPGIFNLSLIADAGGWNLNYFEVRLIHPENPANLLANTLSEYVKELSWQGNNSENTYYILEYKLPESEVWDVHKLIDKGQTSTTITLNDNTPELNFRIIAMNGIYRSSPTNEVYVSTSTYSFRIEAEAYDYMSGIETEYTSDGGGGINAGWIDDADWMSFKVNIPVSGPYSVSYRIASPNGDGLMLLDRDAGTIILDNNISVPNTGGWQQWQTITRETYLEAGEYYLGLFAIKGGWNINWFEISNEYLKGADPNMRTDSGSGYSGTVAVYPNPAAGKLTVDLGPETSAGITVFNQTGRQVLFAPQESFQIKTFDIHDFPSGIYFLKVHTAGQTVTRKFFKQ